MRGLESALTPRARTAALRRSMRMLGDRRAARRRMAFALEGATYRTRAAGRSAVAPPALPALDVARRVLARFLRRGAAPRRPHLHAGPARLREADGDGLLGRTRPVLAFADMMEF